MVFPEFVQKFSKIHRKFYKMSLKLHCTLPKIFLQFLKIILKEKINKKILKTKLLWKSRSVWGTKKNCYFGLQVSVPNLNSLCPPYLFFYLRIFTDKNSLDGIILLIKWFFKVFFVISFPPYVPSYHPRLTSSGSNVVQS